VTPVSSPDPDTDPELTNSDRYVFRLVDEAETATRQALLEETAIAERTLDRSLTRLEERGYIALARDSGDLRRKVAIVATTRTSNPREN
jgi:DNA-binding MarR family transcriptional regulator